MRGSLRIAACGILLILSLAVPSTAQAPLVHTVAPGDTVGSLARRYDVSEQDLVTANHLVDAARIYPSQKLIIPGMTSEGVRHTVQPGEVLGAIALEYDVSVEEIAARNGLSDPYFIRAGDELVIPQPETPTVPTGELAVLCPAEGNTVTSGLHVCGVGRSYNNTLAVRVYDERGRSVARALAAVNAEIGQRGTFEADLSLPALPAQQLRVEVTAYNPESGAVAASDAVTVSLAAGD